MFAVAQFGSANPKTAFWLVKFLEDVGYDGPRHFDAHAYRTEDYDGVRDFARGCMRTYLILKERAAQWNADAEIQSLIRETASGGTPERGALRSDDGVPGLSRYSPENRDRLLAIGFDRTSLSSKGLAYERLDQLTTELLLGVRS